MWPCAACVKAQASSARREAGTSSRRPRLTTHFTAPPCACGCCQPAFACECRTHREACEGSGTPIWQRWRTQTSCQTPPAAAATMRCGANTLLAAAAMTLPRPARDNCGVPTSPLLQEERPMTGFFFGNVDNKLRLKKEEGKYIDEVRRG
jgi:hypothetical protein